MGQVKLWVFPEGTRNSDKKVSLLPFKKGAFHVAQSCGLPILPIVFSKHSFLDDHGGVFEVGEGIISVLPLISSNGKSRPIAGRDEVFYDDSDSCLSHFVQESL